MSNDQYTFAELISKAVDRVSTPCIVGLDPSIERMPATFLRRELGSSHPKTVGECCRALLRFNEIVLEAVQGLVSAVKPQVAFYERFGPEGMSVLQRTVELARSAGFHIILDAKRGDIASTAEAYADAYLSPVQPGGLNVDCITLNPYLGIDSLEPFIRAVTRFGKGVFICVKTSNPGAVDFQDLDVGGTTMAHNVARRIADMQGQLQVNRLCGIGAVVGATFPEDAQEIRRLLPNSVFLVPGIGAQGGIGSGLKHYFLGDSMSGALVNSSRSVMYPLGLEDTTSQGEMVKCIRTAALELIATVDGYIKTCRTLQS